MKKYTKHFLFILLLLIGWIGIDRYMNITDDSANDSIKVIWVSDSIWTNVPNGKWVQFDSKYKAYHSIIYAEEFNPIFRTWKNVTGSDAAYSIQDEYGMPMMIHVTERDANFTPKYEFDFDLFHKETINDLTIHYGEDGHNTYVVRFDNEECMIIIQFHKTYLNELKPTIHEIYDQLQK